MITFSIFFDPKVQCYRARFRGGDVDTVRRVPPEFWQKLGHKLPRVPEKRFEQLALRWAASEVEKIRPELRGAPAKVKMTWSECAKLADRENPDMLSEKTTESYERWRKTIEKFAEATGQRALLPEDIDIAFATRYRNWRLSTPGYRDRKPRWRTIKNELQYIRLVCRFALNWGRITGCEAIRLHKLPQTVNEDTRQIALTEEEFGKLIDVADDETESLLVIGVTTLLRKANLLALRGEWFDFERRWLTVDKSLVKGRLNQRRTLSVPVSEWSIDAVHGKKAGYVFENPRTGRHYTWLESRLETLVDTAGVRPFSLHDLRTTGISWLRRHGVDRAVVKVLAHHSMTHDVTDLYTHVFEDHLRESVAVFDRIRASNGW